MNVQINKDTLTSSTALGASDELAMLIDTHREAYKVEAAVMRSCDSVERELTPEEEATLQQAYVTSAAAMDALCTYRCQTMAEASVRARYLLEQPLELSSVDFENVLNSMAETQLSEFLVGGPQKSELDSLVRVHRKADHLLDAACEFDTPEATDSERAIFEAAQDAEAKALLAVCAYPCRTAQEGRARRAYLKRFIADDLLTDEQVLALAGCAPAV